MWRENEKSLLSGKIVHICTVHAVASNHIENLSTGISKLSTPRAPYTSQDTLTTLNIMSDLAGTNGDGCASYAEPIATVSSESRLYPLREILAGFMR